MGRKINIEEVRGFLEASNRQFEQGGIYLERALFKRDDNGVLTGITYHARRPVIYRRNQETT